MNKNVTNQELSPAVSQELSSFVAPLLVMLDENVAKQLVRTVVRTKQMWNCGPIGLTYC
jgi:hypothetical protein